MSAISAASTSFSAFETVPGALSSGYLILCDHASHDLPPEYDRLGLPDAAFGRHIAYDIGARTAALRLADRLGAPAVLSTYSRLLIDPNRGIDDPTLIMQLSDGAVVPGNARIDSAERRHRLRTYYEPYHEAISAAIEAGIAAGTPPALIAVHSFTPSWKGNPRPWQIGVLWDRDPRLAVPLIAALQDDPALIVGDNEPYSGELEGDCMNRHGTGKGLAHALIEFRQDLIAAASDAVSWADRVADILIRLRTLEGLNTVRYYGATAASSRPARPGGADPEQRRYPA